MSDFQRQPAGKAVPQSRARDRGKVLIVDDDPRNLFSLTAVLEEYGYQVVAAASGEDALSALAAQHDVDCVLVDLMMPGIDGYEFTRRIRTQSRFDRLPVVAVTAKALPEDEQKCLEVGCSAYIAKPIDTTRLLEMLQTLKRNRWN